MVIQVFTFTCPLQAPSVPMVFRPEVLRVGTFKDKMPCVEACDGSHLHHIECVVLLYQLPGAQHHGDGLGDHGGLADPV